MPRAVPLAAAIPVSSVASASTPRCMTFSEWPLIPNTSIMIGSETSSGTVPSTLGIVARRAFHCWK